MSFDKDANYIIDSVEVTKLWNKYDISCKFDKDINIFIGINGSYKTTFIMLIYNLLTLNFLKLIEVDFEGIQIKIRDGRSYRIIKFLKDITNQNETQYVFEISGIDKLCLSEHDLKIYGRYFFDEEDDDMDDYNLSYSTKETFSNSLIKSKYAMLKKYLYSYINVDYLTINRYSILRRRPYTYFDEGINLIDVEIKKLVRLFIRYQSEIKTSINNCSNEFLKKAFEVLLKDIKVQNKITIDSKSLKDYKTLLLKMSEDSSFKGIDFKDAISKIESSNVLIKKVISSMEKKNKPIENISQYDIERELSRDEYMKLINTVSLFPKFQILFELYKETESKKLEIEEPTKYFMEISNEFLKSNLFPDKKLVVTADGSLMLQISNSNLVSLNKLSSGEKQLIVLLLRTLLQKGKKGVYITDEPELSLHLSWQEKLITSLNKINPNMQLIFATHSPDIVAQYDNKIKQMEDILK